MSNHTPGTWKAHERRGMALGSYGHTVATDQHTKPGIISGCDSVADGIRGHTPEEALANARLIAAAPELLSILKEFTLHASLLEIMSASVVERAVAAIAKAEGR